MPRGVDRDATDPARDAVKRMLEAARARPRVAAAILAGAAVLFAWGFLAQGGPDESLRRVQDAGVLRVGLEATFPPFETTDGQGNFGGYDIDVAHAIAAELGVRAAFDNLSYDTLYDALAVRRVDVLVSMIVAEPERSQDVSYSPAYYDAGQVLAVRPGSPITGVLGLPGRRVAVEAGSIAEEEARRLAGSVPGLAILTYSEPGLALAAMVRGEAEAAITDPVSLAVFRRAGGQAVVAGARLTSEPYVVAVRRQDRALAAEVIRAVNELRVRGELDRLAAKWF